MAIHQPDGTTEVGPKNPELKQSLRQILESGISVHTVYRLIAEVHSELFKDRPLEISYIDLDLYIRNREIMMKVGFHTLISGLKIFHF